jgi:hypothetical protein
MTKELYFVDGFQAPDEYRDFNYQNLLATEDISVAKEVYECYIPTEAVPIVELWRVRDGESDLE